MNAKSATPLTRLPNAGLVWLEGKWSATVVTTPLGDTFEIRAVKSPVYGAGAAGGPAAWWPSELDELFLAIPARVLTGPSPIGNRQQSTANLLRRTVTAGPGVENAGLSKGDSPQIRNVQRRSWRE